MRPLLSYENAGRTAAAEGLSLESNPRPEGSLAGLNWSVGWLSERIRRDGSCCGLRERLLRTRSAKEELSRAVLADLPKTTLVGDAVDLPVGNWPGNCYAVAVGMLDSGILDGFQARHGALFPAYGIYTGLVDGDAGTLRHGWLEGVNGIVIDPTRWTLHQEYPRIWAGGIRDYDLAGMRLRQAFQSPHPPPPTRGEREVEVWDRELVEALERLAGESVRGARRTIRVGILRHAANQPLERLGSAAAPLYALLVEAGLPGLIPMDNRRWVEWSRDGYVPPAAQNDANPRAKRP